MKKSNKKNNVEAVEVVENVEAVIGDEFQRLVQFVEVRYGKRRSQLPDIVKLQAAYSPAAGFLAI